MKSGGLRRPIFEENIYPVLYTMYSSLECKQQTSNSYEYNILATAAM